ncbi:bacterial regulatory, arsR family protein [Mycobacterium intracellulare]|nr:bacterial regulatory, arsR family protein [Mycobacterium intracellulare]
MKIRTSPDGVAAPDVGAASSDRHTRRAIVRLLLESGTITAGEIGDRLGLAAAGVRRHLDALIEAGDAEATAPRHGSRRGAGVPRSATG